jgi:GT2 family glycosyltransferase
MKIAFVTINFHNTDDTLNLVGLLKKNTLPLGVSSTVYVVDNDRSGDLKNKLKEYPHVVYIESPGNIGFAAGNNLGLRKFLIFLHHP